MPSARDTQQPPQSEEKKEEICASPSPQKREAEARDAKEKAFVESLHELLGSLDSKDVLSVNALLSSPYVKALALSLRSHTTAHFLAHEVILTIRCDDSKEGTKQVILNLNGKFHAAGGAGLFDARASADSLLRTHCPNEGVEEKTGLVAVPADALTKSADIASAPVPSSPAGGESKCLRAQDLTTEAGFKRCVEQRGVEGMRSALLAPLVRRGRAGAGRVFGTLELFHRESGVYKVKCEQELTAFLSPLMPVLATLGNHVSAAFALENFERKCGSVVAVSEERKLLSIMYSKLSGSKTLSAIMRSVSHIVPNVLHSERALLILLPPHSNKVAFFYLFSDNHVYNFSYENTFVEEIVRSGEPRVFSSSRSFNESAPPVFNITNEEFACVKYVPLFDTDKRNVIAVLELSTNRHSGPREDLEREVTQEVQGKICAFVYKMKNFCSALELLLERRGGGRHALLREGLVGIAEEATSVWPSGELVSKQFRHYF